MSALKASRGAQWPLMTSITLDFSTAGADTMATVVGNVIGGAAPASNVVGLPINAVSTNIYEMLNLPVGATIVGGEIVVETAVVGPTVSTLSLGDLSSATRHATTVDLKTAARTALTLTGYRAGITAAGKNLRGTVNNTVAAATAGRVTIRALYVTEGRTSEVQAA
jgi:hypothetical protein